MVRQYSNAEKSAYYAKKAAAFAKKSNTEKKYMRGSGAYYAPPRYGRPYIRGRGAYTIPKNFFNAKKVGSTLGGAAGGMIGNMLAPGVGSTYGKQIGSKIGSGLGSIFKKITGWGDYEVKENSILYPNKVVPSFGEDSIRVKKREFITNIDSSSGFVNNVFPIQPGLDTTFPWLSAIANNYEQYRFNGLVFQFVSTSSDAIASTTDLGMGQVILATDYNSLSEGFVNAPQMLSSMFSNSGKPSENILHAVECAPTDQAQKLYYTRSGDAPQGADLRLYDMGTFQIATNNMPATYSGMGQLWVSYDITFCKAIQNNQLGFNLNSDVYALTTPDNGNPFGTSRSLKEFSNLGTTVTGNQITFPQYLESGYYLISCSCIGSSATLQLGTITCTNGSILQVWQNNTATAISMANGVSGTVWFFNLIVKIEKTTTGSTVLQISGPVLPVSPTHGDLIITQINGEIYV